MKNFNGTPEEAWEERKRLCKVHGINMIHAGCYLNNYHDDFLCKDCNVKKCDAIHDVEGEKPVEETGEESGQDSVTSSAMSSVTEATDA